MFDSTQYELLDFGDGEKLERFGTRVVRRETPSVPPGGRSLAGVHSDLQFRRSGQPKGWLQAAEPHWILEHGQVKFSLRATPTGQVGVFPEQATNWDWIENCPIDLAGLNAINLFGYTGGMTLALANAGANVTHVDAAKTVVSWARENATLGGLGSHPIRWIVEDAMRFVRREIQRGRCYDIVVADPPSFGRGPSKETWKLDRDLPELLSQLAELTAGRAKVVIISGHTPGYDGQRLANSISDAWRLSRDQVQGKQMTLTTKDGRTLPSGHVARWMIQ